MSDHYILRGHEAVACDLMVWARWLETNRAERVVAKTAIGDAEVSTVFLGLNHSYVPDGPPMIFETLVFGGEHDGDMERYSTWEEAETGHKQMCEMLTGKGAVK